MLGLIILNIYSIFKTIYESFFKTGDFGKGNIFVGFDNYVKLFHDAEVWQALINTFKYAIVEVPFSIAIALMLAAGVLIHMEKSALAVITILPMTMTLVDAKLFPVYMLIWLMVGFSLTAYADSWFMWKLFRPYFSRDDREEFVKDTEPDQYVF